jgi:uncharacterized peroxidase-related enzyme
MSRFPSLPERPVLADVFKRFPDTIRPLLEYHDMLLRGPSLLSVAERELIAAFVSRLNACEYCAGAHGAIAEIQGMPTGIVERLATDVTTAPIDKKLQPLLAYARKLTLTPARMVDADARSVFAAGWDETALFHTISICALFNFMNRMVDGCGIGTDAEILAEQRGRHTELKDDKTPYQTFGRRLGIIP